jgi:hypothetical protein
MLDHSRITAKKLSSLFTAIAHRTQLGQVEWLRSACLHDAGFSGILDLAVLLRLLWYLRLLSNFCRRANTLRTRYCDDASPCWYLRSYVAQGWKSLVNIFWLSPSSIAGRPEKKAAIAFSQIPIWFHTARGLSSCAGEVARANNDITISRQAVKLSNAGGDLSSSRF